MIDSRWLAALKNLTSPAPRRRRQTVMPIVPACVEELETRQMLSGVPAAAVQDRDDRGDEGRQYLDDAISLGMAAINEAHQDVFTGVQSDLTAAILELNDLPPNLPDFSSPVVQTWLADVAAGAAMVGNIPGSMNIPNDFIGPAAFQFPGGDENWYVSYDSGGSWFEAEYEIYHVAPGDVITAVSYFGTAEGGFQSFEYSRGEPVPGGRRSYYVRLTPDHSEQPRVEAGFSDVILQGGVKKTIDISLYKDFFATRVASKYTFESPTEYLLIDVTKDNDLPPVGNLRYELFRTDLGLSAVVAANLLENGLIDSQADATFQVSDRMLIGAHARNVGGVKAIGASGVLLHDLGFIKGQTMNIEGDSWRQFQLGFKNPDNNLMFILGYSDGTDIQPLRAEDYVPTVELDEAPFAAATIDVNRFGGSSPPVVPGAIINWPFRLPKIDGSVSGTVQWYTGEMDDMNFGINTEFGF